VVFHEVGEEPRYRHQAHALPQRRKHYRGRGAAYGETGREGRKTRAIAEIFCDEVLGADGYSITGILRRFLNLRLLRIRAALSLPLAD
jgi:hypothetical protein